MIVPVALVQTDAGPDPETNVATAAGLADDAASGGARLIALPEYLQYRGPDEGFRASAQPIPGPFSDAFAGVARRQAAWILAGSLAESSGDPARPYNTSVLIGPDGEIRARYRKLHLFDVAVDEGPSDTESARVTAGEALVVADVDGMALGMTICYDLRFPELYRALALRGAEVLAVPSNFTERTGRDHWEVLLRARAIENGAWVIAPSQIGGPPGQPSFGRTMIVDPWGTVVAQAPDRVGIIRADIDTDRVASVRRQIPALANRRPDAYGSA
ncbi:MAG TPA: carbon-nitrogen hydrolase family protein [Candidatus Eisenbacteria bacterium]|nr:carbon-nitrogen hydrolase family protein [Candidatus Eisenbacteria bacterium]